jgi:hypothetical protein
MLLLNNRTEADPGHSEKEASLTNVGKHAFVLAQLSVGCCNLEPPMN